jgi:spore cortex biosynthesis protein YabQ
MILSMSDQARMFLAAAGIGAVIGFIYDVFRILRKTAPHARFIVQLEDLLFWVGVTLLMFYFLLVITDGEMRWYTIAGAVLGAVLYLAALSRFVLLVSVAVIEFIKRVVKTVIAIILWPFVKIYKLLKRPVLRLLRFLRKNLRAAAAYGRMKLKKSANQLHIIHKKV